jgi:uncharacterized metal-binding protein YceD (DUF177 family)
MIIDVRAIPAGRSSRAETLTVFEGDNEWPRFVDGLQCRCDFDRTEHEIVVDVVFHGRVVLACARCLEDVEQAVSGRCVVIIRHADTRTDGGEQDDVDEYFFDDEHQEVDISQSLYEEVMTELPMKPLCREACPGVAPAAGGVRPSATREEAIDPRWEALRRLKQRGTSQR